jgi:hypothetical protein
MGKKTCNLYVSPNICISNNRRLFAPITKENKIVNILEITKITKIKIIDLKYKNLIALSENTTEKTKINIVIDTMDFK